MSFLDRLLKVGERKNIRHLEEVVARVNELEPQMSALSDGELAAKTEEFRRRLADGETVYDIEAEAFAVVREAARRTLGLRPYDVQIQGAAVLLRNRVAEMRTGEGKTLVSVMPVYVRALEGKGVHVVTVNEYLAARDAEWMGKVHRFLGLEVGLILNGMDPAARRAAYQADLTYGTNSEFGFDYLRDNMAMSREDKVQRGHHFAIVDEVDSILIDEARTPLIISGAAEVNSDVYAQFARIARQMRRDEHYEVDEKKREILITESGIELVERSLGVANLYEPANVGMVHQIETALKAKELFERDVDYIVDSGEVKIVDEFTGRIMEGRRYSEGLHQAIEAKEGVKVLAENQTVATITLQNYFRMYSHLAGMTGTAATEEEEFAQIYGLEVNVIPTNRPVIRIDQPDLVFVDEESKYAAVVEDIAERHRKGQPVLVGTTSIEKSEYLSSLLGKRGIPHEVLNAKHHAREAQIIAQAGRPGAVTVATNMAGRGVDILLGGNAGALAAQEARKRGIEEATPEWDEAVTKLTAEFEEQVVRDRELVKQLGGLYVLGTERHESRRIDNQLRGRAGRQGDPGESRFYLSAEDELMRRFGGERLAGLMARLPLEPGEPIEHKAITNAIERAQRQVESQNFEIRKNLLKYDEVANTQRVLIYQWRDQLLDGKGSELIADWREEFIIGTVNAAVGEAGRVDDETLQEIRSQIEAVLPVRPDLWEDEEVRSGDVEAIVDALCAEGERIYADKVAEMGDVREAVERHIILTVLDRYWAEHLTELDYLRAGVGLRAMGQQDPLVAYRNEALDLFDAMVQDIKRDSVRFLSNIVRTDEQNLPARRRVVTVSGTEGSQAKPVRRKHKKIGRNEPCPCGSGKKFKNCHIDDPAYAA